MTSATLDPGADLRARHDRAFLGHPAGLGWLAACELWERFSYYGMQTLLVDRKSTRLNSSHLKLSRMPSSA